MSEPIAAASTKNVTDVTPTASDAVAVTATVPVTCAPPAGAVMLTAGAVVSGGGATFTVTVADVPMFPAASRASARSVYDPAATPLVFQLAL